MQRSAFQFLRANELLRIRRACHWSKFLVDDYHRPLGPPFGSKKIRLILPSTTNEVIQPGWQSLASFLEEDNTNSLGKLCLRFKLDWNMDLNEKVFENPLIKDFIDRYGSQIDHLSVRKMFVPPGQHELEFYSKLPKLKSLSVLQACLNTDNLNEYAFPECFGKISKLKVAFIREKAPEGGVAPASFGGIGHDVFQWRLLAFCKSLRHYEAAYFTQLTLLGLIMLDTRLSRLQYYSSKNGNGIHPNDSWSEDELPFPIESNLKWANVPLYYLSSLSLTSRNFVAPRIVSVGGFRGSETFDDGFVLPNVESMRLNGGMLGENDSHARLIGQLSHEMLPMLKRVQIHNWENSTNAGASRMLSMLWSRLPNLEEVKFKKCSIEDIAFIGEGGEPPFLQLTGNIIFIFTILLTKSNFNDIRCSFKNQVINTNST